MVHFWDFNSWGFFNLTAVLLASLLVANMLKRSIPWLEASLIPTSVLGGGILIVIAGIYKAVTGNIMFDTAFFGSHGTNMLELITYHCLALGFIASTFKSSDAKLKSMSVTVFEGSSDKNGTKIALDPTFSSKTTPIIHMGDLIKVFYSSSSFLFLYTKIYFKLIS